MKEKASQSRREFVKTGATALIGAPVFLSSFSTMKNTVTGSDIEKHFQKVGNWVNWKQTTDTFKFGDPGKEIKKVAIAWKINMDSIKKAIEMEADLFISHESICVNAPNSEMKPEINFALPTELSKFDLLKEADLLVYRCHDLRELGADVGIMTDDYYRHVREGIHADELDFPTIHVNHAVAEEWGIMNLAKYVQEQFPMLEVNHIRQYCPYQYITL